MAQLGDLLSGMLTDVVRARVAADAATAEAVESYRADPALASMSVPRVTISTLTVKLNFAVSGVTAAERAQGEPKAASAEWSSAVEKRISPLIPPAPPAKPPKPSAATRAAARAKPAPEPVTSEPVPLSISVPPDLVRDAAGGTVDPLVEATVEGVVKASPVTISPELREQIAGEVRAEALLLADVLRRRELLDKALHSRLEVDIVADKVSTTKPEAMQSLEVTFSVDDLEEIMPGSTGGR